MYWPCNREPTKHQCSPNVCPVTHPQPWILDPGSDAVPTCRHYTGDAPPDEGAHAGGVRQARHRAERLTPAHGHPPHPLRSPVHGRLLGPAGVRGRRVHPARHPQALPVHDHGPAGGWAFTQGRQAGCVVVTPPSFSAALSDKLRAHAWCAQRWGVR